MIIVGILASLALLAVIIRFALSPQTDRLIKRAARIALAAIALAIIACLILVIAAPGAEEEEEVFAGLPLAEPVVAAVDPNRVYMLIVGAIMLLFVGLIIFLSLREEKKKRSR
jgi:formate hydrogenlyase subunit 3/multisubunit Na+/H+ antiporter MnhD subunit